MALRLLVAWLANAAALWVADWALGGVRIDGWPPLLIAAAVLGLLSAFVKPVLVLLSLPFILVTLGLFLLLINMAVLGLTSWLVPDFDIDGFWTYLAAAIITWLVNTAINSIADVR